MVDPNEIGDRGENIALDYLLEKNYIILVENWKKSRYEIDIIVRKSNLLVFVEVKSGRESGYGPPELRVDLRKQKKIAQAAEEYLADIGGFDGDIRFDVIAVLNPRSSSPNITHIESAFTADFD